MANINEEFISYVKAGNLSAVTTLLESGANVHYKDNHALQWSVETGNLNTIVKLLECNVDPNIGNICAVQCGVKNNRLDIVTALLEFGADVNACNDANFCSSLETAAYYGNLAIVTKLLEYGASRYHYDCALRLSVECHHFEIATVLLENGANMYCDGKHILKDLQKNFNERIADVVLPYCSTDDYEYFPPDYIRTRLVPTKSANTTTDRNQKS